MKSLATELTEDPHGLTVVIAAMMFYGVRDRPWSYEEKAREAWNQAEAFVEECKRRIRATNHRG